MFKLNATVTDNVLITQRFFFCVDLLKDNGRLEGGLRGFTQRHGIPYTHLQRIRANAETAVLKPACIKWLCEDYGINVNYIMFGKGKIFNDK